MDEQVQPTETNEEQVGTPEGTETEVTEVPSGTEQPDYKALYEAAKEEERKALAIAESNKKGMLKWEAKAKARDDWEEEPEEDLEAKVAKILEEKLANNDAAKARAAQDAAFDELNKKYQESLRALRNQPTAGLGGGSAEPTEMPINQHGLSKELVTEYRSKYPDLSEADFQKKLAEIAKNYRNQVG